jgi:hypothetical protein
MDMGLVLRALATAVVCGILVLLPIAWLRLEMRLLERVAAARLAADAEPRAPAEGVDPTIDFIREHRREYLTSGWRRHAKGSLLDAAEVALEWRGVLAFYDAAERAALETPAPLREKAILAVDLPPLAFKRRVTGQWTRLRAAFARTARCCLRPRADQKDSGRS